MDDFIFKDINGNTPLMRTILLKNFTKVKEMLNNYKSEINPNKKNKNDETALMLLCSNDVPMYYSEANYQGENTPLEIVNSLLALGADINMKDKHGKTALMLAAEYAHPLIVKRLIETNRVSDINERTDSFFNAKTALQLAANDKTKYYSDSTYDKKRQPQVIQYLQEAAKTKTADGGNKPKKSTRRKNKKSPKKSPKRKN